MKIKRWFLIVVVGVVFGLWTVACQTEGAPVEPQVSAPEDVDAVEPVAEPEQATAVEAEVVTEPEPEPAGELLGPAEVVRYFYEGYVESMGGDRGRLENNPFAQQTYRDSPYLAPEFVAWLDAELARYEAEGLDPYGYDPVLKSTSVPERLEVGAPTFTDGGATVILERGWPARETTLPLKVMLVQNEAGWQISDVSTVMTDEMPEVTAVVESFYDWLLAYGGSVANDTMRNWMVEEAYLANPYLTDSYEQRVGEVLDSFEGGGYDQFQCAQDMSVAMVPDLVFDNAGMPGVLVRTSFMDHYVLVELQQVEGEWQIGNITCSNTPEGAAKMFYTWYLGSIGSRADGEFRNLLVDGGWKEYPLLTDQFIAETEETLAGMGEAGGFDPILLAQDIPSAFSVDPGVDEGTAIVHLQFGPSSVRHLEVQMVRQGSGWAIDHIGEAEPLATEAPGAVVAAGPDWETFGSTGYGFSVQIPPKWIVRELETGGAGEPEDWPVDLVWQLLPADILDAVTAPPDPNAPPTVAPIQVEVVVGDEDAIARVYRPLAEGEPAQIADQEAVVFRWEPGYTQTVFKHPTQEDLWVVFTDWVTGFPGREAQAEAVAGVVPAILESLSFSSD